jgi:branched-chain amino acid transport system substrate-binding protein
MGWLSADLFIKGLQVAGQNPTRSSYESGLRGVTACNGNGLWPNPDNFSLSAFGKGSPTQCAYFLKLKGETFVPVPANGKPVCGQNLPHSNQL